MSILETSKFMGQRFEMMNADTIIDFNAKIGVQLLNEAFKILIAP